MVVVHASGWGRKRREWEGCKEGWASREGGEGAGRTGQRAEEAEAEKAAWTRNSSQIGSEFGGLRSINNNTLSTRESTAGSSTRLRWRTSERGTVPHPTREEPGTRAPSCRRAYRARHGFDVAHDVQSGVQHAPKRRVGGIFGRASGGGGAGGMLRARRTCRRTG